MSSVKNQIYATHEGMDDVESQSWIEFVGTTDCISSPCESCPFVGQCDAEIEKQIYGQAESDNEAQEAHYDLFILMGITPEVAGTCL